jgi:2-polyprenyl-6-methoxyphenol hydroxylase-like FAD-dependent oxidoreductase
MLAARTLSPTRIHAQATIERRAAVRTSAAPRTSWRRSRRDRGWRCALRRRFPRGFLAHRPRSPRDRYRRLSPNGQPLLTGVALLADAFSCTNPSLGRGISLGLMHARSLRDTVAAMEGDPLAFAEAWDLTTESKHTPWYIADSLAEPAAGARVFELAAGKTPFAFPGPDREQLAGPLDGRGDA